MVLKSASRTFVITDRYSGEVFHEEADRFLSEP